MEPVRPDVRRGDSQEAGRAHARLHHWKWRLDEVYVKISGEMHYRWPALGHEGEVLEPFATKDRDKVTTDGLRFYKAAMKAIGNAEKQAVAR